MKLKYGGLTSGVTKIKKNGKLYYITHGFGTENLILTELKRRLEILS